MSTHPDSRRVEGERIGLSGAWMGIFADDPNTTSDKAHVVIPDFDSNLKWGPCRWQARDEISLPVRGDRCLVLFDQFSSPWIVAWWPFDE